MADTNTIIGSISTFAALMAGISMAVERAVEIIKGAIPPLSKPWKHDEIRAAVVQVIAVACGTVISSQMPDEVKGSLPVPLAAQANWTVYVVIGLLTSGGSAAWNHVLDILAALKTKSVAAANVQPAAASPQVPAPQAAAAKTGG